MKKNIGMLLTVFILGCASMPQAPANIHECQQEVSNLTYRLKKTEQEYEKLQQQLAKLKKKRPKHDSKKTYAVPIPDGAPILGQTDALVTVIEVADFLCPYSAQVSSTLKKILDAYPRDVRLVFIHNPLAFRKQHAMSAAIASECAKKQNSFWSYHNLLFETVWKTTPEPFEQYGTQLDLDPTRFAQCRNDAAVKEHIIKQQEMIVSFGARGTPSFFINGRYLAGAQPFKSFERLIDEELVKAQKSGIPSPAYYEEAVIKKGEVFGTD